MCCNIVVKRIPEDPDSNEDWSATKDKLCDYLVTLTNEIPQAIHHKLDRAHRKVKE